MLAWCTLFLLVAFIALCVWVFLPSRRRHYEAMAAEALRVEGS